MDHAKSFAVLGTGALGGLYGGLLARAGFDVRFLLRSDFEFVSQHGLQVESPLGDFHLSAPKVYARPQDMPPADVVIVAWKTTANSALSEALREVCHDKSLVLVLQNGWDVEREAADVVGPQRVLGGCCFLCSNKVGPGHIRHLDYGQITFGEYATPGKVTSRMQELAEQFQSAGVDLVPVPDLRLARWKKLVWNIPFNGLSVVLGADTSQIMAESVTRELAEQIMLEVVEAAVANGSQLGRHHVDKMLADTQKMVPYDSSMLLDYRARRPIEVESIFGNPLRAAQAQGVRPPRIEMLYQQLRFLDQRNRAE